MKIGSDKSSHLLSRSCSCSQRCLAVMTCRDDTPSHHPSGADNWTCLTEQLSHTGLTRLFHIFSFHVFMTAAIKASVLRSTGSSTTHGQADRSPSISFPTSVLNTMERRFNVETSRKETFTMLAVWRLKRPTVLQSRSECVKSSVFFRACTPRIS